MLSDSWSVRRRASEGLLRPPARSGDTSDTQNEHKSEGIKEEEEEARPEARTDGIAANNPSMTEPAPTNPVAGREQHTQSVQDASHSSAPILSLNTQVPAQSITGTVVGTPINQATTGPPPGIVDVNNLEWQYLDPQGQIQGKHAGKLATAQRC